jgi:hypothetical protein
VPVARRHAETQDEENWEDSFRSRMRAASGLLRHKLGGQNPSEDTGSSKD